MLNTLTDGQKAVLSAFAEFGPMTDVALATFVHHMADVPMSSSGIRTRRAELVRKGLIDVLGSRRMKSGRLAAIFTLTPAGKQIARTLKRQARKAAA